MLCRKGYQKQAEVSQAIGILAAAAFQTDCRMRAFLRALFQAVRSVELSRIHQLRHHFLSVIQGRFKNIFDVLV